MLQPRKSVVTEPIRSKTASSDAGADQVKRESLPPFQQLRPRLEFAIPRKREVDSRMAQTQLRESKPLHTKESPPETRNLVAKSHRPQYHVHGS